MANYFIRPHTTRSWLQIGQFSSLPPIPLEKHVHFAQDLMLASSFEDSRRLFALCTVLAGVGFAILAVGRDDTTKEGAIIT